NAEVAVQGHAIGEIDAVVRLRIEGVAGFLDVEMLAGNEILLAAVAEQVPYLLEVVENPGLIQVDPADRAISAVEELALGRVIGVRPEIGIGDTTDRGNFALSRVGLRRGFV